MLRSLSSANEAIGNLEKMASLQMILLQMVSPKNATATNGFASNDSATNGFAKNYATSIDFVTHGCGSHDFATNGFASNG